MYTYGQMQRYGTRYETRDDRLSRIVDRDGTVHAELAWAGDQLMRLDVPGATLHGEVIDDALLGRAHRIGATTISAIEWQQPTGIPAIAAPGALPPGVGGAVMNVLAVLAARAKISALQYAGPYPSHALHATLLRSFATLVDADTFTMGFLDRAARVAREPLPYAFIPAPHERLSIAGGSIAELRAGLERWTHDGVTYSGQSSPHRLVGEDVLHAEIWIGDTAYARIASLMPDGALVDGPHPVPACVSSVIGQGFPAPLVGALSELIVEAAYPPLAPALRELLWTLTFRWADLGARFVRVTENTVLVNAVLWERIAPLGLARLALALVEVLTPVLSNRAMLSVCASSPV